MNYLVWTSWPSCPPWQPLPPSHQDSCSLLLQISPKSLQILKQTKVFLEKQEKTTEVPGDNKWQRVQPVFTRFSISSSILPALGLLPDSSISFSFSIMASTFDINCQIVHFLSGNLFLEASLRFRSFKEFRKLIWVVKALTCKIFTQKAQKQLVITSKCSWN